MLAQTNQAREANQPTQQWKAPEAALTQPNSSSEPVAAASQISSAPVVEPVQTPPPPAPELPATNVVDMNPATQAEPQQSTPASNKEQAA